VTHAPFRFIHIRNLLTYLSLLCAAMAMLSTVRLPSDLAPYGVGLGIALCVFLDLLDGKFAKLFACDPEIAKLGAQIDSLADVIAFGFVPWLTVIVLLGLDPWLLGAGFLYCVCALTRLAYYNEFTTDSRSFVGLPTTIAGLVWAIVFYFVTSKIFMTLTFLTLAFCMVASLRMDRPGKKFFVSILGVAVLAIFLHLQKLLAYQI
jgi:CDP-diacylglycerol---serine O-phosphatidyltransferase